ncbi:MAG TPA: PepSY-associated TM helix domain-containing protein, partial [Edaphobacter sp.]
MSFLRTSVHHPRKLWLRKALFQVHLWVGIALSLYLVVIALTGAILVFEDELTSTTLPSGLHSYEAARLASVTMVVDHFRATYPGSKIDYLVLPTKTIPAFRLQAVDLQHKEFNLAADPVTGELHVQPRNWLNVVHDLHIYLLLGEAHGAQVNAVGASALLLLAISGLVLWWPG